MNICLFTADEIEKPLLIRDERAQHLIKVLHKKAGDTFTCGLIGGKSGIATILSIEGTSSNGKITYTFTPTGDGKRLLPLILVVGFPRPIQLRRLLRDASSLGVREIHLTSTALGDKSYMKSTMLQRGAADKMLLEGAMQAGSTQIPLLSMHKSLQECIASLPRYAPSVRIMMDNVHPAASLIGYLNTLHYSSEMRESTAVIAAIGSERGWTDGERTLLANDGWTLCSMGERILRTETAVTAAASIILSNLGFMQ